MSPEERREFNCDCKNYEWSTYILNYMKGMSIWALKENQIEPIHGLEQIVLKNKFRFDELKLTLNNSNSVPKNKKSQIYEQKILNEARFYEFFKQAKTDKKVHLYDKNLVMKEL